MIECNEKESINKLQSEAVSVLSTDYIVGVPKVTQPKVVIVGVNEKYISNEQKFLQKISNQSCLSAINEKDITVIKKYTSKDKRLYIIICKKIGKKLGYLRRISNYYRNGPELWCTVLLNCLTSTIAALCIFRRPRKY